MRFYDRYSQLCTERGIEPCSQVAADMFGVSKSTISSWNTKNTFPKGDTVAAVADALGVSSDFLLGRTDDPTDYSDGDVIASLAGPVLDEFNGDAKRAADFQRAVAEDAAKDRRRSISYPTQYYLLDEIDKAKADAYIEGLLAADKYHAAREKNA